MKSSCLCNRQCKGITLIALIITIIVLMILAGVSINMVLGQNGLLSKSMEVREISNRNAATEIMNLKLTQAKIQEVYNGKVCTLQDVADILCQDDEIEYVDVTSKKIASIDKITVGDAQSIYVKLKQYIYEFKTLCVL